MHIIIVCIALKRNGIHQTQNENRNAETLRDAIGKTIVDLRLRIYVCGRPIYLLKKVCGKEQHTDRYRLLTALTS